MKYVEYAAFNKPEGCFICDAVKSEDPDEKFVLHRDEKTVIIMNIYPYNTGHILIAPVRHVANLEDLSLDEIKSMGVILQKSILLLKKVLKPDGFNVGLNLGRVAGAGLEDHLHFHVVPRWNGDTNFMPIIANTKVIPEAIRETFLKLKKGEEGIFNVEP